MSRKQFDLSEKKKVSKSSHFSRCSGLFIWCAYLLCVNIVVSQPHRPPNHQYDDDETTASETILEQSDMIRAAELKPTEPGDTDWKFD